MEYHLPCPSYYNNQLQLMFCPTTKYSTTSEMPLSYLLFKDQKLLLFTMHLFRKDTEFDNRNITIANHVVMRVSIFYLRRGTQTPKSFIV